MISSLIRIAPLDWRDPFSGSSRVKFSYEMTDRLKSVTLGCFLVGRSVLIRLSLPLLNGWFRSMIDLISGS